MLFCCCYISSLWSLHVFMSVFTPIYSYTHTVSRCSCLFVVVGCWLPGTQPAFGCHCRFVLYHGGCRQNHVVFYHHQQQQHPYDDDDGVAAKRRRESTIVISIIRATTTTRTRAYSTVDSRRHDYCRSVATFH
jgi:hypothetical protein